MYIAQEPEWIGGDNLAESDILLFEIKADYKMSDVFEYFYEIINDLRPKKMIIDLTEADWKNKRAFQILIDSFLDSGIEELKFVAPKSREIRKLLGYAWPKPDNQEIFKKLDQAVKSFKKIKEEVK